MASYIKRGGSWRVQICVKGVRRATSFTTKREAQEWASREETKIREQGAGKIPDRPFLDLMTKYQKEVSIKKKGAARERMAINVIMRDPLANISLPQLTPQAIAEWRDRRLAQVSGATVDREMNILSHACTIARREWGWLRENPCSDVSRPQYIAARKRRPTDNETAAILLALGYAPKEPPETISARVGAAYLFAIETAMRAGEIVGLERDHVFENHVHIPRTKNGYARDVPLSKEAQRIIDQVKDIHTEARVFGISGRSLDALFRKAKKRAMIEDLHFHDTRREALTRLAKKFDVMELAKISGHRDLRILQNVYFAPTIEDLASKL